MKALKLLMMITILQGSLIACSSKSEKNDDFKVEAAGEAVTTKYIEYQAGGKTMKGFLAMPTTGDGPFPGVLVVHEWWGQTDYPRNRAIQLAEAGYAAFAVDMYGEGKTASHPKDAKAFSKKVFEEMDLAEEGFREALATLRKQDKVDPKNIAAIGYCFGGAIVLEMARRGVDLKMVASFHGDLTPLVKNDIPPIKTRMLIFNGAADKFVPKEAVKTVRAKLKASKVRYKLINYKGAMHGFSNPEATKKGKEFNLPLAYNKRADELSWNETMKAFKIVFK